MKKLFIYITCALAFLATPCLYSFDASPRCYRDLELNFFDARLVSQALSNHGVNQSVWTPIIQDLQKASKSIPDIIKRKTQNMVPSPFDPVFVPDAAYDILFATLNQIFIEVLIPYQSFQNIRINPNDVQDMFNYIKEQQTRRIDSCIIVPKKP